MPSRTPTANKVIDALQSELMLQMPKMMPAAFQEDASSNDRIISGSHQ